MNKTYLRLLKEATANIELNDSSKGFKVLRTCTDPKCSKFEIEVDNVKCPVCGKKLHPVRRRGMDHTHTVDQVEFDETKISTKEPLDVEKVAAYSTDKTKKNKHK